MNRRVIPLLTLIILLFDFTADCSALNYKVYKKSSSTWKIVNYTISDDDDLQNLDNSNGSPYDAVNQQPELKFSSPEECARQCVPGERPKTCYYHWTFEFYKTLGGACNLCRPSANLSISNDCQCILGDGADVSGLIIANRKFPGPAIQVCLGDLVIIDVKNNVPGNEISIHWHGLYQNDWQHYDGVPFVTQCPITEGSTFRYQFQAQNSGTFFWHAHSGLHKAEGLDGPIIIRVPKCDDPNKKLYDYDDIDNIIFLSDWLHDSMVDHFPGKSITNIGQTPDNFLINGMGQYINATTRQRSTVPLAEFFVKPGQRYRFRMINSLSLVCPVQFTIQDHNVTIIALDGEDVRPQLATTLTTFSAERIDFVLKSDKPIGSYWIQLRGIGACADQQLQQHAILRYIGSEHRAPNLLRPRYATGLPLGIVFNPLNDVCNGTTPDAVCVKNLQSSDDSNPRILRDSADVTVLLTFDFYAYNDSDIFAPNTYRRFVIPGGTTAFAARVNKISYVFPPSPLISQLNDIPADSLCDGKNLPAHCENQPTCYCTHVVHIPLNAVVELIVADGGPNGLSHPFHLHGYGFHVISTGLLSKVNITEGNKMYARQLDRAAYPSRNNRPVTKDTLAVPSGGYTIVRFIADNPGWWYFHCHFLPHLYNGMSLVIHVGEPEDIPKNPEGFPRCGNFLPPVNTPTSTPTPSLQKSMINKLKQAYSYYFVG